LSIITGKYPQQHGIVHNKFYHKELNQVYSLGAGKNNSAWLTASPIWEAVEKQGLKSALYFWPESQAKGRLASQFFPYNGNTPNKDRVDQVITWLKLPKSEQPSFITLYFSTVDSVGHTFGVDSPELEQAVQSIDDEIGRLLTGIDGVLVNLLLVSDHGMTASGKQHSILWKDITTFPLDGRMINGETQLYFYANKDADIANIQAQFIKANVENKRYNVYSKGNYPKHWHFFEANSPVIPDLIIDSIPPFTFVNDDNDKVGKATHGYDLILAKSLEAIFIANGPDIKSGVSVRAFENVYIYSIISRLLGLPTDQDTLHSESLLLELLKLNN
jgi:predicted AlkP superfamily pyrophosphatase or phosphodiesterase